MRTALHYFSILVVLQLIIFVHSTSQHGNNPYLHHEAHKTNNLTLSEYLWESSSDLLPLAWNATFIRGVANGDMDPNFYGDYILQDAIYCRKLGQLWRQLQNNSAIDSDLASYAGTMYPSYFDCAEELFGDFNIKDDGEDEYGVIQKTPVTNYIDFTKVNMLENPYNMLIVTYPCLKLWSYLTHELWLLVKNSTTNPYKDWVCNNSGNNSAIKQATQIDAWSDKYNWTEALYLFRMGIEHEINFFDQAGASEQIQPMMLKNI